MRKRVAMVLGCVVVLCLAVAPAVMAGQRGVTDTEIRIGQYGPQT